MKIDQFEMERMQSTWENVVEMDLSESGVRPVTLREMIDLGLDIDAIMDTPLSYSQSNGTIPLRENLAALYPGATPDHIEVTNGTSEANYMLALALIRDGDEVAFEVPNYMQYWGLPKSLGAKVNRFHLRIEQDWEPDWEEFDRAVNEKTRLVYISNPNNPTGSVLSHDAMRRIVERCDRVGAYLIADEVYLGAEIHRERTRSFWGMSDRVIVTSGLSKAYGIPGVRIGWMVGPRRDCRRSAGASTITSPSVPTKSRTPWRGWQCAQRIASGCMRAHERFCSTIFPSCAIGWRASTGSSRFASRRREPCAWSATSPICLAWSFPSAFAAIKVC